MNRPLLGIGPASRNHRYEGINRVGLVTERRTGKTGPQVRYYDPARNVTSAWTPVQQRSTVGTKDYNLPELGERVQVEHLANGPERAVVVGCIYNEVVSTEPQENPNNREVLFRDGTLVRYDPGEKRMTITAVGALTIKTEGAVTWEVPTLSITAPVIKIIGDVEMAGTFDLDGIILNTHKHTDVEPGSANTGEPTN